MSQPILPTSVTEPRKSLHRIGLNADNGELVMVLTLSVEHEVLIEQISLGNVERSQFVESLRRLVSAETSAPIRNDAAA